MSKKSRAKIKKTDQDSAVRLMVIGIVMVFAGWLIPRIVMLSLGYGTGMVWYTPGAVEGYLTAVAIVSTVGTIVWVIGAILFFVGLIKLLVLSTR